MTMTQVQLPLDQINERKEMALMRRIISSKKRKHGPQNDKICET